MNLPSLFLILAILGNLSAKKAEKEDSFTAEQDIVENLINEENEIQSSSEAHTTTNKPEETTVSKKHDRFAQGELGSLISFLIGIAVSECNLITPGEGCQFKKHILNMTHITINPEEDNFKGELEELLIILSFCQNSGENYDEGDQKCLETEISPRESKQPGVEVVMKDAKKKKNPKKLLNMKPIWLVKHLGIKKIPKTAVPTTTTTTTAPPSPHLQPSDTEISQPPTTEMSRTPIITKIGQFFKNIYEQVKGFFAPLYGNSRRKREAKSERSSDEERMDNLRIFLQSAVQLVKNVCFQGSVDVLLHEDILNNAMAEIEHRATEQLKLMKSNGKFSGRHFGMEIQECATSHAKED